jgi:hypothetical protein
MWRSYISCRGTQDSANRSQWQPPICCTPSRVRAVGGFQNDCRADRWAGCLITYYTVFIIDLASRLELVEGSTLRQLLGRGRAPLKKTLQIASQMADALATLTDPATTAPAGDGPDGDRTTERIVFGTTVTLVPASSRSACCSVRYSGRRRFPSSSTCCRL